MHERDRAKGLLKTLGMTERRRQAYSEGIDRADDTDLAAASDGLEHALADIPEALETAERILARGQAHRTKSRRFEEPRPRHVVLFLAANPHNTNHLALADECAAVERELRMSAHRDDFEFHSKWAVTVDEMARHLSELAPTVIHFSGHGGPIDPAAVDMSREHVVPRSVADVGGIHLHDERGGSQFVSARELGTVIQSAGARARILVLNACYTDVQADELCAAVDCVVGMTGTIQDAAARSFASSFYRALSNRCSVHAALEQATARLAAKQLPEDGVPRCRTRASVDASQIMLGAPGVAVSTA
jgi:hypothetical protein